MKGLIELVAVMLTTGGVAAGCWYGDWPGSPPGAIARAIERHRLECAECRATGVPIEPDRPTPCKANGPALPRFGPFGPD